jgi:hypothetical protein
MSKTSHKQRTDTLREWMKTIKSIKKNTRSNGDKKRRSVTELIK